MPATPATEALPAVPPAWTEPFLRIADIVVRLVAAVLTTLLAVVLALVAGFLLPMRAGGVPVPVISFALVLAGNAALVWFARYATASRLGIVGPCVAWLGTMLVLGTRTAEGDLVLPGDWRGIGLIFVGASTLAVAGFIVASPSMRRSPAAVVEKR